MKNQIKLYFLITLAFSLNLVNGSIYQLGPEEVDDEFVYLMENSIELDIIVDSTFDESIDFDSMGSKYIKDYEINEEGPNYNITWTHPLNINVKKLTSTEHQYQL